MTAIDGSVNHDSHKWERESGTIGQLRVEWLVSSLLQEAWPSYCFCWSSWKRHPLWCLVTSYPSCSHYRPMPGGLGSAEPWPGQHAQLLLQIVELLAVCCSPVQLVKVNPTEVQLVKVNPTEVHLVKVNPTEVHLVKVNPTEVQLVKVNPTEVQLVKVNPT